MIMLGGSGMAMLAALHRNFQLTRLQNQGHGYRQNEYLASFKHAFACPCKRAQPYGATLEQCLQLHVNHGYR